MVIHDQPERLRYNNDQPTAITNVLVATSGSSHDAGDIPLGTPTCSARTRQGRWALYPNGDQVVVVWPGGALAGPPAEVGPRAGPSGRRPRRPGPCRGLGDPALPDRPRCPGQRSVVVDSGADLVEAGGGLLAQRPYQPAPIQRPPSGPLAHPHLCHTTDPAARPQPRAGTNTGRLTAQPADTHSLGPATSTVAGQPCQVRQVGARDRFSATR